MYKMNYRVMVGKYRLTTLSSINIKNSVETLSDVATITIPASIFNRTIEVEQKIKIGDKVTIELGYDDHLKTEFIGYLNDIKTDNSSLKLDCVDGLYHFKVAMPNQELKGVSLSQVLEQVLNAAYTATGVRYKLDCQYNIGYNKYVFYNITGYQVLKKIQDELKANVFFENNTLCVYAPYEKVAAGDAVIYDFSRNIEKSDLKYVKKADKDIEVTVKLRLPNGKYEEAISGQAGGDKVAKIVTGVKKEDLQKIADSEYNIWSYDGYEGDFTGWLLPYVSPTYKVKLKDSEYPEKEGVYYVIATEVNFSSAGGVRKVILGRRLG